jgi:GNAT superfamily N-acetyltransferase
VRPLPQECAESQLLILPDGTTAQVRSARPEDAEALRTFFARLSLESRRRRFFSAFLPQPKLLASLCDNKDPSSAVTLLVIHTEEPAPRIIATGSYLAKDEQTAEVAFAVEDAFQHQGLGTLLLERLAVLAVRNGFTRFWAVTQSENQSMREVFRESGLGWEENMEDGEIQVNLSLPANPTARARSRPRRDGNRIHEARLTVTRTHNARANPHTYQRLLQPGKSA